MKKLWLHHLAALHLGVCAYLVRFALLTHREHRLGGQNERSWRISARLRVSGNLLPWRNGYKLCCFLLLLCPPLTTAQAAPHRIVSLGPINTENVFLLGVGHLLVADTRYCVRPVAAQQVTKIGSVLQVNVEKIISLRPDLVLATALTRPEQVAQMRRAGLRVERFGQPASFTDICQQFLALGRLLGREQEARAVIVQAKQTVAMLTQRLRGHARPMVFLQVGTQPLFGAAPGSFINDFIVLAGGRNCLANQDNGATSTEKVIAARPDWIIIAIMGSETGLAGAEKRRWQEMPFLPAVVNKQVRIIDPDLLCSPSPLTFVQTLTTLARLLHPELALAS